MTAANSAWAGGRFALFVGSNRAPAGKVPLRYAHSDARRLRAAMTQLGRLSETDALLALDPTADELRRNLADLRKRAESGPTSSVILFFYSGHAEEGAMLLGEERFLMSELRRELGSMSSDVQIAILDSCQSGAFTKQKGVHPVSPYTIQVEDSAKTSGTVVITSSTAEEASIESDDIGGSLFSHFLISGLRGAADSDQDGNVTLEEAYRYSYHQTVSRSVYTRAGIQHPTYHYRLEGRGGLVLSWPTARTATLQFGEDTAGTYLIFDRTRNEVVAELQKAGGTNRRIQLSAGDYFVKKRLAKGILLRKVKLAANEVTSVRDSSMHTVPYDEDVTKGLHSPTFRATWKYGAPPVWGTAHTLRRGEVTIGVTHPTGIGLTDNVMISTRLAALAILVPSLAVKARFLNSSYLAAALGVESYLLFTDRVFNNGDQTGVGVKFFSEVTAPLGGSLLASLGVNYRFNQGPPSIFYIESEGPGSGPTTPGEFHWIGTTGSLILFLTENDSLQLIGGYMHPISIQLDDGGVRLEPAPDDPDYQVWQAGLVYAHAWSTFRLSVGVSRVPLIALPIIFANPPFPIPHLDFWFRW